ncbi:MAG: hypothetical protein AAF410_00640 [Pseudomonadota bacterium]
MLREIIISRKKINGLTRRWFSNEIFDVFVFFNHEDELVQLQLCYDKNNMERVNSCSRDLGYNHARIDTGRNISGRSGSPVFFDCSNCDIDRVKKTFIDSSLDLDDILFDQIYRKLIGFKLGIEF